MRPPCRRKSSGKITKMETLQHVTKQASPMSHDAQTQQLRTFMARQLASHHTLTALLFNVHPFNDLCFGWCPKWTGSR